MKFLYLLGYPVSHSVSPAMQNAALKALGIDCVYRSMPVTPQELRGKVAEMRGDSVAGFNVTIPHKVPIIPLLDEVDDAASSIGAVNTVVNSSSRLIGYNTDYVAATRVLEEANGSLTGCRVVILGAGGASRAVAYGLATRVEEITILARDEAKSRSLADHIRSLWGDNVHSGSFENAAEALRSADILVNATPVGMHPHIEASPVRTEHIHKGLLVFDLVYNPERTRLIAEAEAAGARTIGGLRMLIYQGSEALMLWTGREAPESLMMEAARNALGGAPT